MSDNSNIGLSAERIQALLDKAKALKDEPDSGRELAGIQVEIERAVGKYANGERFAAEDLLSYLYVLALDLPELFDHIWAPILMACGPRDRRSMVCDITEEHVALFTGKEES